MSVNMTRWVLWISLLVLLPLPVYNGLQWGFLPPAYIIYVIVIEGRWELANVGGHALIWALILAALAHIYAHSAARWEAKIRGSVMAVTVFSLLIIFSSVPVYRPLDTQDNSTLTLPWLYE